MWGVSDKQALRAHGGPLHDQVAKWIEIVRKFLRNLRLSNNKNKFNRKSVLLGEMDANTDIDCETKNGIKVCNPPTQLFGIEQAISHPQYSPTSVQNDIGIIRLDRNVDFSVGKARDMV
jgi:hypothetical protein